MTYARRQMPTPRALTVCTIHSLKHPGCILGILLMVIANDGIGAPSTNTASSSKTSDSTISAWFNDNLDEDAFQGLAAILTNVDESFSQVAHMFDSKTKTEDDIAHLESQLQSDELLLKHKKQELRGIQQKIDFLKLTPNQIATIERYNHSLDNDPHLTEWLSKRQTWFEMGEGVIIAAVFFVLGIMVESRRQQRGHKFKRQGILQSL